MAKNKSEEVVQPTISAVTQSETADTNLGDKTPQEIRNERADAIKQQRDIIRDERKADNTNQANIDLAKQNIETLRSNAKLNIEQAKANRRDKYADEAISSVAKWMEDTGGQPLTEESLASILTPKQLWHFQKKYNQGSNWGNALGGRAFFGNLNDRTIQLLTEQANKKIAANKKAANERKTYVPYGDVEGGFEINNSRLNEMKDWGNSVTNDNITPEQAQALYSKLESYGLTVPKKTVPVLDAEGKETKDENGNVITQEVYDTDGITDINSLYSKLSVIGDNDDNADVLDELGFRDEAGNIARPHRKTYEEILAEQEKKKQELQYINQQKALARQQARLGLADIAAGIGDMIKASGGALVDKRDYQDMYNRLTAQQQKNFDNYLARMEVLKQEEKAKQRLAEERAYSERLLNEKYAREDALLAGERAWTEEQDRIKHQRELEKIRARGQEQLRLQKEKNKAILDKFNNKRIINFGGVNYTYAEGAKNSVISQLLPIVKPYFNDVNGYKSMLAGIESSEMNEYGKGEEIANMVICAISDPYLYLSEEDKTNVTNVLKGLSSNRAVAGEVSRRAVAPETDRSNGGMY